MHLLHKVASATFDFRVSDFFGLTAEHRGIKMKMFACLDNYCPDCHENYTKVWVFMVLMGYFQTILITPWIVFLVSLTGQNSPWYRKIPGLRGWFLMLLVTTLVSTIHLLLPIGHHFHLYTINITIKLEDCHEITENIHDLWSPEDQQYSFFMILWPFL